MCPKRQLKHIGIRSRKPKEMEGNDSTLPTLFCSIPTDIIINERKPKVKQYIRFTQNRVVVKRQNVVSMKKIRKTLLLILLSFFVAVPLCLVQLSNYFMMICVRDNERYDFATYSIQHESNPLAIDIGYFKDLYDKLISNQSDNYIYYELYSQYLENTKEISPFFSAETDELMDSCFAIECVQINENIIRDYNLSVSQGKLFSPNDYKYGKGSTIPILLGSYYSTIYNVGDAFCFTYLFDEYTFEVIGFLREGNIIELGNHIIPLDKYIIMPSFEVDDDIPITNGIKIHYANKTSGIVKLDINKTDYFHSFIEPLISSADAGKYSWIAQPSTLQFKELFNIDLKTFRAIIILICFVFVFFIGLIIYKVPDVGWNKNSKRYLSNILHTAIIFVTVSAFYYFINIIYAALFGITLMKSVYFIIIGGASIAIVYLCKLKH